MLCRRGQQLSEAFGREEALGRGGGSDNTRKGTANILNMDVAFFSCNGPFVLLTCVTRMSYFVRR